MEMTDMKGEIKVKKMELYDEDIYCQHVIVTLESGDKFAVYGEIKDLVILNVEQKNAITPYYISFGTDEESEKAGKHYLENGIIEKVKIPGFENDFYKMVDKYELAIKNAIIQYVKAAKDLDIIIKFNDVEKNPKLDNIQEQGSIEF